MAEGKPPPSLKDLDERLRTAQAKSDRRSGRPSAETKAESGLGFGMRIATELVVALVVGVGVGILLDRWLDTKPWFLVVFFLLGAAAGMLNVFRAVAGTMTDKGTVPGPDSGQDRDKTRKHDD